MKGGVEAETKSHGVLRLNDCDVYDRVKIEKENSKGSHDPAQAWKQPLSIITKLLN